MSLHRWFLGLCFDSLAATAVLAAAVDIKSFGARGDGRPLDTHAINAAIEAAAGHVLARLELT